MKCEVRNKEGYEEYIADSTSSLLQTPFRYRTVVTTPDGNDYNCGTGLWLLYKRVERAMKQSRLRTHSCTGA
ncbi:hypothetical protein AVEN_226578-1 [Araneus ventricosus]|uniref:Uncharacterized protein n=1 Tax=Araneus ventricosus TaxID=182803 RepID=A0A4Y2APE6_ARAVE|nr:hypothetical protein AVEN_226578-1 [Araneus ventricosus]